MIPEKRTYDFVIVGSGSAGGVLASRLTEDADCTVLLIEAGTARRSLTVDVPGLLFMNFERAKYNWRFDTTKQKELGGREVYQPRGKGLGGSSSINAMVYMRGHAEDFDGWERLGAKGWNYASVLPYFKKSEAFKNNGDPTYRGGNGPVKTQRSRAWAPVQDAFMQAGKERGYPETDDVNGFQQEGFSMFDMNIGDGVRNGTAKAFIRPAMKRPNLEVATDTYCAKVVMEGSTAKGVALSTKGKSWTATAKREVILCAGAAKTPQILMLSGIGPADHLAEHDIPVVVDLKGVGENLQDHAEIHLKYAATKPVAYNKFLRPDRAIRVALQWLFTRDGVAATNGFECGAFFRSSENVPYPDQLIHYYPVHLNGWMPAFGKHGFTLGLNYMRCNSVGTVKLKSPDPKDTPRIDPNYMSDPDDMDRMVSFLDLGRDLAAASAFDDFRGAELEPGPEVQTRVQKEMWIRDNLASAYHLSCTCKMGTDEMAVTGPDGKVHGTEGLRVVDASIMPMVTNGNLNAPTMMMAERISDMIRGRPLLPPEKVPVAKPIKGAASQY
ncbi:choline dehydrogenase [Pseudohalocynthiibacter aestuariivivens]|nr:choline dehydrogenase [Pseudohalocynthiibacter aestuariivivens]QIE45200.1 choline dehydrogenase [Pseudohalocynthiibacter aestuariivivens]